MSGTLDADCDAYEWSDPPSGHYVTDCNSYEWSTLHSSQYDADCDAYPWSTIHPSQYDATAVDIIRIHGLQEPEPPWEKAAGERVSAASQLAWTYNGILQLSEVATWSDTSQTAQILVEDIALQRRQSGRLTTPLIWITDSSTRRLTSKVLQRADQIPDRCTDARSHLSTYSVGMIILHQQLSTPIYSPLLVLAQLMTCAVLWCFKSLPSIPTLNQRVVISREHIVPLRSVLCLQVSRYLEPTTALVFVAIAWGTLSMIQYHIHSADRYQKLCLLLGLAGGLLMVIITSSGATEHALRFALHSFTLTITVALASSACGHWVWRNFFSTQESRLERKLQEWSNEAYKMDQETNVIKVHEIL